MKRLLLLALIPIHFLFIGCAKKNCVGIPGGSAFIDSCGICVSDAPLYTEFADEHWSFSRWIQNTPLSRSNWQYNNLTLLQQFVWNYDANDHTTHLDDVIIDGTHQLSILLDGKLYLSSCFNNNDEDCEPISSIDTQNENELELLQVIRDCQFYKNISKYDQFVGGWDDIADSTGSLWWKIESPTEDTVDVFIMTNNKQKYLNLRQEDFTSPN